MSAQTINTFPFLFDKNDPTLSFPSPPPSISSDTVPALDFESFTHCSPSGASGVLDDVSFDLGLSPVASTASPSTLFTPDGSLDFSDISGIKFDPTLVSASSEYSTAEALSHHHLARYFHYRALATQAEQQSSACADEFQLLCDEVMSGGDVPFQPFKQEEPINNNMIALQQQPQQVNSFIPPWDAMSFNQNQAAMHHAQAQAHMQAHDVAAARAKSLSNIYVPSTQPIDSNWSRQSISTMSNASSLPSTPTVAHPAMKPVISAPVPSIPEEEHYEGEDDQSISTDDDIKPSITNVNGGGRGYIPGQTPDDPKKRHKCNVCGRGFARAFNLKSHVQTHNPSRPKPYMCPHSSCRRGFSRLHDLERHRQGIHSDGPLVDAKRHGVAPAVARAQVRMQKRAQNGGLT